MYLQLKAVGGLYSQLRADGVDSAKLVTRVAPYFPSDVVFIDPVALRDLSIFKEGARGEGDSLLSDLFLQRDILLHTELAHLKKGGASFEFSIILALLKAKNDFGLGCSGLCATLLKFKSDRTPSKPFPPSLPMNGWRVHLKS